MSCLLFGTFFPVLKLGKGKFSYIYFSDPCLDLRVCQAYASKRQVLNLRKKDIGLGEG